MATPVSREIPDPLRHDARAAAGTVARRPGLARAAALTAWCWPVVVVTAPYVTWLIAWGALGHRPRPSLDDPKSIGFVVDVSYAGAMLLLVTFPGAIVAGLAAIVWHDRSRESQVLATVARATLYIILWLAAIAFMRADPLDVGYWFMD